MAADDGTAAPASPASSPETAHPAAAIKDPIGAHKVVIRPYPSIVYLYPTMLTALVCAAFGLIFRGDTVPGDAGAVLHPIEFQPKLFGFLFLSVLAFNMCVLAFDFTRATFVALVFFFGFIGVGGWLLESQFGTLSAIAGFFGQFLFFANPEFYFGVFLVFAVIFAAVFVQTRFDYWELQHNELIHHRGIVGDIERFSAQYLRWSKEIPDVFEYCLLLSGRLVMDVRERERPIVLNHVLNINRLEQQMVKIQSIMHVKVETH